MASRDLLVHFTKRVSIGGDRYVLASIRVNLVNAKFCLDIY